MKRWIVSLALVGHILVCDGFGNSEQRIWEQWQESPEYEKYNELIAKDQNSLEAKKLKEKAIDIILKSKLRISSAKISIEK